MRGDVQRNCHATDAPYEVGEAHGAVGQCDATSSISAGERSKERGRGAATHLQLLSPKEADKRLRSSGGEVEDHVHCCEGALDSGAEERLQTRVMN